jgi:CheY-like chemotaxis protein
MAKTLLLADDSVTIQKVVGISFANEDVELVTVDNGDDAVLRAREVRPDLILADVVMPGKNGYEVCEAVKGDPDLGGIPVLLLTGTFEAFDEERAAAARADGHITKPFEAQALVDKVNALLAAATAPAAAAPPASEAPQPIPAAPQAAAPAAAAPAAPAPDSAADDDGFDFFDDEVESDSGPPSENATTAFELDAGESAFDFAPVVDAPSADTAPPSESPTVVTPAPEPPAGGMPDATVALGPAPGGAWGDDELDAAFGESAPPAAASEDDDPSARTTVFQMDPPAAQGGYDLPGLPQSQSPDPGPAAPGADDDFSFDAAPGDDLMGDFDADEPAREAVSNPELGRDFAVSSSDLGDPLDSDFPGTPGSAPLSETPPATPEPPAAQAPVEPEPTFEPMAPDLEPEREPTLEPELPATPEPGFAEASAPAAAEEPTVAPDETAFAAEAGPVFEATPEPEEPPFHASPELGEIPVEAPASTPVEAPVETTEEAFAPLAEAAAEDFAPPPPASAPLETEGGGGPDLSPVMRERVHEAMEKIAWEAFADLPDQIVRQALARIEAIAWEVIPQMAEAMIQEEIRRMKGESE